MKTVKGIYAEAKIFTDDVEEYAEAQVKMICDNEVANGSTICMMPDIHPGKIAPIGLSMTITDKVIPQLLKIMIKLDTTTRGSISLSILAMNVDRLASLSLLRFLARLNSR